MDKKGNMTKISQREARRLKKKVTELENILDMQQGRWSSDWPSSTQIGRLKNIDPVTKTMVGTARVLHHAVVVTIDGDDLVFWGCQAGK